MIPSSVVGSVAGSASAINVIIGFKPDYVEVVNTVTGTRLRRFRGFTGETLSAAGAVTIAAGLLDYEGSLGEGFTIPAGGTVNAAGQQLAYIAHRSGPGST